MDIELVTDSYACMMYIVSPLAGGGILWRPPAYSLFALDSTFFEAKLTRPRPNAWGRDRGWGQLVAAKAKAKAKAEAKILASRPVCRPQGLNITSYIRDGKEPFCWVLFCSGSDARVRFGSSPLQAQNIESALVKRW